MGKFIDLTGQRFGRLYVLCEVGRNNSGKVLWLCRCDCGNEKIIIGGDLRSGRTTSCGCYHQEVVTEQATIHGKRFSRLYRIWCAMKRRCNSPSSTRYADYGGRGIKVCAEWEHSFSVFQRWAMENGYSDELSIDRIDVNAGYSPENCRWADAVTQARNKRSNRDLIFQGKKQSVAAWADETGISAETIYRRLDCGWPVERALTEPVHAEKCKNSNA